MRESPGDLDLEIARTAREMGWFDAHRRRCGLRDVAARVGVSLQRVALGIRRVENAAVEEFFSQTSPDIRVSEAWSFPGLRPEPEVEA